MAATPPVSSRLRALPGVLVIPRDADLKARHAASRVWNETWLAAFFHKPCNHELFVLQSLNMEVGIALAERDGVDWLLHIDTDELMYPGGGPSYSLQAVLAAQPAAVDTVVFPNYEAMPERDDVAAPFEQVREEGRGVAGGPAGAGAPPPTHPPTLSLPPSPL